ncbi:hypothetical protein [Ornithinimicrobium cerasi]|uniref:Uncharacterized protein n=1 Tax=Ornithinimicrobium cerasi TaxID=2248773 RepID=A0A285VAR3_9MICO|nr:hypothetical protein [Ornithinimicrobium cerasi]SOC51205.1 hypothetical protein SAMN05421879_10177 [Ornithinimicrobium cerasi]
MNAANTAESMEAASIVQMLGALGFGLVLGWFLYYLNRYRREVALGDLTTVIGAIGGAAVLALFPAGTDLFGAYGIGLAGGFFGYFTVLILLVRKSPDFTTEFLIDGRRKLPERPFGYPDTTDRPMGRAAGDARLRGT